MGPFEFLQQILGDASDRSGSSNSLFNFDDDNLSDITRGIAMMSGANPSLYGQSRNRSGMTQLIRMMRQSGLDEDQQRALLSSLTRRRRRAQTSSYPAQRRRGLFG